MKHMAECAAKYKNTNKDNQGEKDRTSTVRTRLQAIALAIFAHDEKGTRGDATSLTASFVAISCERRAIGSVVGARTRK